MMTADHSNAPKEDELELEIAAFMGPHIKRARVALVVLGVLYAVLGYLMYREVAAGLEYVRQWGGDDRAYAGARNITIALFAASVGQVVLAAVAGKRTMLAFYGATALFATLFALLVWATGTMILITPPFCVFWWVSALAIGLGLGAAWKADKLRRDRAPAQARALAA
jgi:hypothetical protein